MYILNLPVPKDIGSNLTQSLKMAHITPRLEFATNYTRARSYDLGVTPRLKVLTFTPKLEFTTYNYTKARTYVNEVNQS